MGEDHIPRPLAQEHATHPEHSIGTFEGLERLTLGLDHDGALGEERIAQLLYPREETVLRHILGVEGLQRGADQGHRGDGDDLPDASHHRIAELLHLGEPLRPRTVEEGPPLVRHGSEPGRHGDRFPDHDGGPPVPLPAACREATEARDRVVEHAAELREPRERRRPRRDARLVQQGPVLEHAVVVERDGHDVHPFREPRRAGGAEHVVEESDLRGAEPAVAGQAPLGEDPLRDAVPRDELHVPLEHRVIQRFTVASTDEIGAERLEEVFEREDARPLPHRIRDRDLPGETIAGEHVVGVRAVVHQVDHDALARESGERLRVPYRDRRLVEQVQRSLRERVAELVVHEEVERRHDLVDVQPDPSPDGVLAEAVLHRVRAHRQRDRLIGEERVGDVALPGELEAVHAGPEAEEGPEGGAARPATPRQDAARCQQQEPDRPPEVAAHAFPRRASQSRGVSDTGARITLEMTIRTRRTSTPIPCPFAGVIPS